MKNTPHKKHGGAREGAGRKATFLEPTKPFRIPISQIESVRAFLHQQVFPQPAIKPMPLATHPESHPLPVFASGVRAGFPSPADDLVGRERTRYQRPSHGFADKLGLAVEVLRQELTASVPFLGERIA